MLKRAFRSGFWLGATCMVSSLAHGAAISGSPDFEYPELSVTPRASERLDREAARENTTAWTNLLPFQISGLTTLAAGIIQKGHSDPVNDPDGRSGYAGMVVGGGWLAGSVLLAALDHPYSSGVAEISGLPRKTTREQLTRERLAEEAIDAPARLACRLAWISAATNFAASVYMMGNVEKNSIAVAANITAMAASLTPLIFTTHWAQVASDQQNYKKRIYGPVASGAVFAEPVTGAVVPGVLLSFAF